MLSKQYQLQISSGTLYWGALIRIDILEKISPPSSEFLRAIAYRCVTMDSLLISLSMEGYYAEWKNTDF
jgi:hypothetical protein